MSEAILGLKLAEYTKGVEKVAAGEQVFQAGQTGDCMYIVKSGQLRIRIGRAVVETVGPGGIFGEMALLHDHDKRSATVEAVTDAEIVRIDAARFEFLVQNVPKFAIELMRLMARRLMEMNKRVRAPA